MEESWSLQDWNILIDQILNRIQELICYYNIVSKLITAIIYFPRKTAESW